MSGVIIYHNPKCGTSRNTLALIRNSGVEPTIIEYLQTPPSKAELQQLINAAGITPRELLREKEAIYSELGLDDAKWTDEEIVDSMLQHPILINRPMVVTPLGTRFCRPSELVLEILPGSQQGAFAKEDGEQVVDANGQLSKR
jgi:arsenate reductase